MAGVIHECHDAELGGDVTGRRAPENAAENRFRKCFLACAIGGAVLSVLACRSRAGHEVVQVQGPSDQERWNDEEAVWKTVLAYFPAQEDRVLALLEGRTTDAASPVARQPRKRFVLFDQTLTRMAGDKGLIMENLHYAEGSVKSFPNPPAGSAPGKDAETKLMADMVRRSQMPRAVPKDLFSEDTWRVESGTSVDAVFRGAPDDTRDAASAVERWPVAVEKRYPGTFGFVKVTRPGFAGSFAMVYAETFCGGECGNGVVYVLENRRTAGTSRVSGPHGSRDFVKSAVGLSSW